MNENEDKTEQQTPVDDIVSYMHGNDVDISIPNIPLPTAVKPSKKEDVNKDVCDVSFKFAFVGAGQGVHESLKLFIRWAIERFLPSILPSKI